MSSAAASSPRQVARLLALLPYLQARPGARVEDVAAAFSISPTQLVADLRVLWFCGLPGLAMGDLIEVDMEAVEGSGRITVTNADYLSRPLRLDAVEAAALLVAVRALADTAGPGHRELVDRVLAKLEAVASSGGPEGRREPRAVAAAPPVEVRVSREGDPEVAAAIRTALDTGHRLHLVYDGATADRRTERDVDPRRLRTVGDAVYLDGWCHLARADRSFRLARVSAAAVLDALAEPPLEQVAAEPGTAYHRSSDDILVTLDLAPAARWVAEYHPVTEVSELPDGGLRVLLPVADPRFLVRLVLRLAGNGRVVEPAEIADQVREAASRTLAAYGASATAQPG
jgi:proteasome accessory factor C